MEPYRGTFGAPRPDRLRDLALPPRAMPSRHGLRPLHAWRYVALLCEELMVCAASVRIGPLRQSFWAIWDRRTQTLSERTVLGRGEVALEAGRLRIPGLEAELHEEAGVETICPTPAAHAWTRKQGGIAAVIRRGGRTVHARAIVDDTAAYYPRRTEWYWAAGVGTTADGRPAAWNLVAGVNDPPRASERTLWIDGEPSEVAPQPFAADLTRVGGLECTIEAERVRDEHRGPLRSRYRQPFGRFTGELPDGTPLAGGFGVMEHHDVLW